MKSAMRLACVVVCMTAGPALAQNLLAPPTSGVHLTSYGSSRPPTGAEGLCTAFKGACGSSTRPASAGVEQRELALAAVVNRAVNAELIPLGEVPGERQTWSLPSNRSGDCKHYVMLKKQRLVQAGIDAGRLMLAVVMGGSNELHAVLVLRTTSGDYVLDNLSSGVHPWKDTGYTFLKMQNPHNGARWDVVLEGPRASRT